RFFEVLDGDPSMISKRDAKLFTNFFDVPHQLFASFFGELRNRDSDNLTVVVRSESKIRLENRLFDILQGIAIVGLNHEETGLWCTQSSQLVQRCGRTVIVDHDVL